MASEEESKSIFIGSKKYLEKSFLEELNYKIWSTKGARFEADKRLTIISKMSNEYSDKSTPRVPDESTPDLVTNNPSYFTTGLY